MKPRDFTTVPVGGSITVSEGDEFYVTYVNGHTGPSWVQLGNATLVVVGKIMEPDYDDCGAIVDGQYYPPGQSIPQGVYLANVFSQSTGEVLGHAHIPYHMTDQPALKISWVHSDRDYLDAAAKALKAGNLALVRDLVNFGRRERIQAKWDDRRFARELAAEKAAEENVLKIGGAK